MVMDKLEENLECVTFPLVLDDSSHVSCVPIKFWA
jgi:hypothetical protein